MAILILCKDAILVWHIPPLSPRPPYFSECLDIPTLFRVPLLDDLGDFVRWGAITRWYSGSSRSLYCNAFCKASKLYGLEIAIKPGRSDVSFRVIHTCQITDHEFRLMPYIGYRICDDTLVSCWGPRRTRGRVHVRPISSHPVIPISGDPIALYIYLSGSSEELELEGRIASCPVSGRLAHPTEDNNKIVILDYLPYS